MHQLCRPHALAAAQGSTRGYAKLLLWVDHLKLCKAEPRPPRPALPISPCAYFLLHAAAKSVGLTSTPVQQAVQVRAWQVRPLLSEAGSIHPASSEAQCMD